MEVEVVQDSRDGGCQEQLVATDVASYSVFVTESPFSHTTLSSLNDLLDESALNVYQTHDSSITIDRALQGGVTYDVLVVAHAFYTDNDGDNSIHLETSSREAVSLRVCSFDPVCRFFNVGEEMEAVVTHFDNSFVPIVASRTFLMIWSGDWLSGFDSERSPVLFGILTRLAVDTPNTTNGVSLTDQSLASLSAQVWNPSITYHRRRHSHPTILQLMMPPTIIAVVNLSQSTTAS